MNKPMALIFLIRGIVLLMLGYNEAHSLHSGISHLLTGSPSEKSKWMLISGTIAVLAGIISLLFNSK